MNKSTKYKIGLKLFTNNVVSIKMAEQYYSKGLFDFLELMVLPGVDNENHKCWQRLKIPYIIHVPHAKYGFNLSDPTLVEQNKKTFNESRRYTDTLKAEYIIVHPGLKGEIEETIRQIKGLKDKRIAVENKPFISLRQTRCVGSSPEEIRQILEQTQVFFCLDVVHAIKAAYTDGKDPWEYLIRFVSLKPKIVHLCDCLLEGCFDEHLNLGKGELDLPRILDLFLQLEPGVFFTLEVPEKSYQKLTSFKQDRLLLAKYLIRGRTNK